MKWIKWVKWILRIVVAGVLTPGTANIIYASHGKCRYEQLNCISVLDKILNSSIISFWTVSLFVLRFCSFSKKIRRAYSFLIKYNLYRPGANQHYIDDGMLNNQYIVRYTGFIVGLTTGYLLSYRLQRLNKWTSY